MRLQGLRGAPETSARGKPNALLHHSDPGTQDGFKRSSQHSEFGGCDEGCKAQIGAVRTSPIAVARTALCCGAQ